LASGHGGRERWCFCGVRAVRQVGGVSHLEKIDRSVPVSLRTFGDDPIGHSSSALHSAQLAGFLETQAPSPRWALAAGPHPDRPHPLT
jgi:hypothetical protein